MLTRQKMNFRDTLTCHAAVVGRSTLLSFHASFKILQNISILHFCAKKLVKQDFQRQNCNFVTKRKRILIASRMLDSVVYHHQNHT